MIPAPPRSQRESLSNLCEVWVDNCARYRSNLFRRRRAAGGGWSSGVDPSDRSADSHVRPPQSKETLLKGRNVLARVLAFSTLAALIGILPITASASQKTSTPTKHITHISPVRTVNLAAIAAHAKSGTTGSGTLRYPKVPHHQVPKVAGGTW